MINAEVKVTNLPVIGPQGLSITTPDHIEPINTKDIFEILRWMREDLIKIHQSFAYVHQLRSEMTTVKAIHLQQKIQYKNQAETVEQLKEQYQAISDAVGMQAQAINKIAEAQTRLAESAATLTDTVTALSGMALETNERAKLPWWKKVLG